MRSVFETLEAQLMELVAVIPNLIKAAAILLIGWLLAKLLQKLIRRLLASVGADRLANKLNEIDIIDRSNIRLVPSKLFSYLVYYIVLFIFAMAAVEALGMQAISELMNNIINYLPKLLAALMVLIVGIMISDFLKRIVLTACQSLGIPAARLIANFVFYFLFLNVIMITLKQADLQTAFMETNMSIILGGIVFAFAIGYGMASRDLMANLLASFYNKERVRTGDIISIDGVRGEIVDMDSTTMTIRSDKGMVVVPLGKLSSEKYEIHTPVAPPPPPPAPPNVPLV